MSEAVGPCLKKVKLFNGWLLKTEDSQGLLRSNLQRYEVVGPGKKMKVKQIVTADFED